MKYSIFAVIWVALFSFPANAGDQNINVANLINDINKNQTIEEGRTILDIETLTKNQVIKEGIKIKIDILILIEKIYISPSAPIWFKNLVEKSIYKYGYKIEVHQSEFNKDPIF